MLRKKQKRVYDWLGRFIQEYGYAPGYDEIRKGLGFNSLSTVYEHLRRSLRKSSNPVVLATVSVPFPPRAPEIF